MVNLEQGGFSPEVIAKLVRMGHQMGKGGSYGGFQGIIRDSVNHVYHGASEFRKDGYAGGY